MDPEARTEEGARVNLLDSHTDVLRVRINDRGFKALVNPAPGHSSHWTFEDERSVKERWWRIQPGDVVIDVGADYGSYTLSALAMGAEKVYAWSPPYKDPTVPVEAMVLAKSLQLNGWQDRCSVFTTGLWSEPGWLVCLDGGRKPEFYATEQYAYAGMQTAGGMVSLVRLLTLDSFDLQRADWLKIDAEGAELEILKGGIETIKRCRPKVLLEHHDFIDATAEARETAFLRELGYKQEGPITYHSVSHSLYTL